MDKKKLRYAILKEIYNSNLKFTEHDLDVSETEFDDCIRFLDREGYIGNVFYADNRPWIFEGAFLTEKGENYLEENSAWKKTYNTLKELRDWIK